jgi:hypothetical protein
MVRQAVLCTVRTPGQVVSIINELRDVGFPYHDISILLPDLSGAAKGTGILSRKRVEISEDTLEDADPSEIIEGALGWVVGIRSLSVPDAGSFIAVGPIVDALSDAVLGLTLGGLTGALNSMGLSDYEAKQYEDSLKKGSVLISVHTDDLGERICIKAIFRRADAQDIATTREVVSHRR